MTVRAGGPEFPPGAGVYIADPWDVCFEPTLVPAFLTPREALFASSVSHGFQTGLAARASEMDAIRLGLHPSQVPAGYTSVRDLMARDPLLYFSLLPPWKVYCYGAQELAEQLNIGDVLDVRRTIAHQDAMGLPHSMPIFCDRHAQRRAGIKAAQHRSDWPQLKEKIDAGQLGYVAKCHRANLYALHFKTGEVVLACRGTAQLPDVGKTLQLLVMDRTFVTLSIDRGVQIFWSDRSRRLVATAPCTGLLQAMHDGHRPDKILVRLETGALFVCHPDYVPGEVLPLIVMPPGVDVIDAQFIGARAILCMTDGSLAMVRKERLERVIDTSGLFFHCLLGSTSGNWGDAFGIDPRDGTVISWLEHEATRDGRPSAASKPPADMRWMQTSGEAPNIARIGFANSTVQCFFIAGDMRNPFRTGRRPRLGTIGAQPGPGLLARAATSTFRWLAGQTPPEARSSPPPRLAALQRARDMENTRNLAWDLYERTWEVISPSLLHWPEDAAATREWVERCRADLVELRALADHLRAVLERNPDALCLNPREMRADANPHSTAPNVDNAHALLDAATSVIERVCADIENVGPDAHFFGEDDAPGDARAQP